MKWETVKLSDVTEYITDGDHQPAPKANEGIHFIKIKDIDENTITFDAELYVPNDYYDNLPANRKPVKNDILYTVVGSYGIPAYVHTTERFCFERNIALLHPNDRIIPRYLYYCLKSPIFYKMVDNIANGSAQKLIPLSKLSSLEIHLPPLSKQNVIVNMLSAYDNLIENNQNQIKLLEEAAQRLYKEWFINLRFPGHESTPIHDGIPEGWNTGSLNDIAVDTGKAEKREYRDSFNYYLPIDCLPKKSLSYLIINDISLAESSLISFAPGDILFGAMRPYFHKVVVARDRGLTRSTCFVINARKPIMWAYLTMLLFSKETIDYATKISVGTTMPYVRWKDFINMKIVIPAETVLFQFGLLIEPLIKKAACLAEENMKLEQARDRLLPKLMSGEIEV